MQFKVSDQNRMPDGLAPTMTAENLRPAAYYQAVRAQKLALSSLSVVNSGREKEKFLKARSSDQVRRHFAAANLQVKVHSAANENKTLKINDYDVVSQLRKTRLSHGEPGLLEGKKMGLSSQSFMKHTAGSHSFNDLNQT